ncbi:MAG TPA: hypothetical protein VFT99_01395, partial [Roseiflexaceae bacterium]|nr:hypothetical protein [Roseiflexaceae bacterium]
MATDLATTNGAAGLAEQAAVVGDLSKLSPDQRMRYYGEVCHSLKLNPLTRPFEYIVLNGKLTLYARRDATDQLRKIHGVSIQIVSRERLEDVYVVTARATTSDGRCDESIGAVPLTNLRGEALANAYMKAETKAKRRVTLSIVGLGMLDETEVGSIADARPAQVNYDTGEIVDMPAPTANGDRLTDKQMGAIRGMARSWEWSSDDVIDFAAERGIQVSSLG